VAVDLARDRGRRVAGDVAATFNVRGSVPGAQASLNSVVRSSAAPPRRGVSRSKPSSRLHLVPRRGRCWWPVPAHGSLEIVMDAAYAVPDRCSRSCTGNFFIDEDMPVESAVTHSPPLPRGRGRAAGGAHRILEPVKEP